jgi:hypothetical protein
MPPSDGIPLQNHSCWSRKCPRVPRERSPSLDHVSDVPRVIPRSACSGAAVEPFEGPAFEPLDSRLEGGGVNRAKLKFTKLITTTSRVSVRNIIESAREGGKQIASK